MKSILVVSKPPGSKQLSWPMCDMFCFHIGAVHFALQRFYYTPFKRYCAVSSTQPGRWAPTWCLPARKPKMDKLLHMYFCLN